MKWVWYMVFLTFCAQMLMGCNGFSAKRTYEINQGSSIKWPVTTSSGERPVIVNIMYLELDAKVDTATTTGQDAKADLTAAMSEAASQLSQAVKEGISEMRDSKGEVDASQEIKDSYNPVTTTNNTETQETDQDKSEDDSANQKPDNDNGDEVGENNKPPGEEDQGDMYGYKYVDTLKYVGPIQIAPAGQQGNSTYYYFLYRLPKGEHGYQTYSKKFLIKYPDGKAVTINDSRHDYNKKGYWYRPGDSSGHKEVHSMEVYWGKDGQWKSTPKADREKSVVKIYSNKERKK